MFDVLLLLFLMTKKKKMTRKKKRMKKRMMKRVSCVDQQSQRMDRPQHLSTDCHPL